jgi:hypothetical protein
MSVAPILKLRQAIVSHLLGDAAVTSTTVDDRIYGERAPKDPAFPFVRYGASDALPGHEVTAPLHIFSKSAFTDDVNAVSEAIAVSLDGITLTLGDGRRAHLTWSGTRVVGDGIEQSEWHAIVTITANIPRDCS